jgi:hypothetical protein
MLSRPEPKPLFRASIGTALKSQRAEPQAAVSANDSPLSDPVARVPADSTKLRHVDGDPSYVDAPLKARKANHSLPRWDAPTTVRTVTEASQLDGRSRWAPDAQQLDPGSLTVGERGQSHHGGGQLWVRHEHLVRGLATADQAQAHSVAPGASKPLSDHGATSVVTPAVAVEVPAPTLLRQRAKGHRLADERIGRQDEERRLVVRVSMDRRGNGKQSGRPDE